MGEEVLPQPRDATNLADAAAELTPERRPVMRKKLGAA